MLQDTNREYICCYCFLMYDGYYSPTLGREFCPACDCKEVMAGDNTGTVYWCESLGDEFIKAHFWYDSTRVSDLRLEILKEGNYRERSIDEFRNYLEKRTFDPVPPSPAECLLWISRYEGTDDPMDLDTVTAAQFGKDLAKHYENLLQDYNRLLNLQKQ